MCKKCHRCFVPLEVLTDSADISMKDNKRISGGKITSLMLRRSGSVTLLALSGKTVAPDTVINTAHLTLRNANGTELITYPLSALQRDYNSPEPLCLDGLTGIDLASSTIKLSTGAAGYSAAHVIELIFGLDCDDCNI